jgi:hypothetical protein
MLLGNSKPNNRMEQGNICRERGKMRKDILYTVCVPAFKTTQSALKYFIICFACFVLRGGATADINEDLIAYWNFNEGQGSQVSDSSGLGNTGNIVGATWSNGVSGKALSFDGAGDYVEVDNKPAQQITTDQLSISLWFNLRQNIGNTQSRLFCKQQYNNNGNSWGLEIFGQGFLGSQGNQLVFHDSNGSAFQNSLSGRLLDTGTWYHVGVVDNAGQVGIYLNGELIHTSTGYGIPSNIPADIMIGRTCFNMWGSTFYFNGLMDEIRLYDRALSAGEMEELYLIPEPATILLIGLGFLNIARGRKR